MNQTKRKSIPVFGLVQSGLIVGGLLAGPAPMSLSAQEETAASLPESAVADPTPGSKRTTETEKERGINYSAGIAEILKLADAGISQAVIRAFVEHSKTLYQPTSADLIALKEHGVADDVTTALLNRSAKIQAQSAKVRGNHAAPLIVRRMSTRGYVDPESYEFWQLHYAYPRALSYSYKTLSPYYPMYRYGVRQRYPFRRR